MEPSAASIRRLGDAVGGLAVGDLHRAHFGGGWTVAQVISHINACSLVWLGDLARLQHDPGLRFLLPRGDRPRPDPVGSRLDRKRRCRHGDRDLGLPASSAVVLDVVRKEGKVAHIGWANDLPPLPVIPIMAKTPTVFGVDGNGGRGQYERSLELVRSGRVDLDPIKVVVIP